jgi:hypothetical protein
MRKKTLADIDNFNLVTETIAIAFKLQNYPIAKLQNFSEAKSSCEPIPSHPAPRLQSPSGAPAR